jgi:hypothetical protein
MAATQTNYPWRATLRTAVAFVVAVAAAMPLVYAAVTLQDPATATGAAAVVLAVSGAVTRVMAAPAVDAIIRQFLPWLAPDPARTADGETEQPDYEI